MASAEVRVEVVLGAGPGEVERREINLPSGATVADALQASGLTRLLAATQIEALRVGRWGRLCDPGTVLHDRDRIELTRPLAVDPKEARRRRHRRDGPRRTGPPARD